MTSLVKAIEKSQIIIGSTALVIFFVAIIIQIITRYIGISVTWTEEISNYSFIWAIFMGAAVMLNRREHFAFDALINNISESKRIALVRITDVILIIFNGFITYYGILILNLFWHYRWESIPELKMGYVWIAIPIMSVTMIIYSLNHIINSKNNTSEQEIEGGL